MDINKITLSFLEDQGSWIFLPQNIKIYNNEGLLASNELLNVPRY